MKFFIILSLVSIFCLIQLCFCDDPYGYGLIAKGGRRGRGGGYGKRVSLDRVVKRRPVGYLSYGRGSKSRKNYIRPLNLDTYNSPLPSPALIFGKGSGYGSGKARYGSGRVRYGYGRPVNGYRKAVYGAVSAGYGTGSAGYGSVGKLKPVIRLIDGFERHSLPIKSPEQYDSDLYSGADLDGLYSDSYLDSYSNSYLDSYSDSYSKLYSESDSYVEPYTGLYSYSSSIPLADGKDLQDVKDGEVISYEEYDGGFEIVRKSVY